MNTSSTYAAKAREIADLQVLREVEIQWLAGELGASIANLGYAVGLGVAPKEDALKRAAEKLFERYAKMIEMTRAAVGNEREAIGFEKGKEEAAKVCDEAEREYRGSKSEVIKDEWFQTKAEEAYQLAKSIRALPQPKGK